PAANGKTRVSGRLGKFCADAMPVETSSASIAPKTFTRRLAARRPLVSMASSLYAGIRIMYAAVQIIARLRCANHREIGVGFAVTPLRAWPNAAETRIGGPRALNPRHVGVAPFIVNNNPETKDRSPAIVSHRRRLVLHASAAALMLRSIAARSKHRCIHNPAALRCVSKHEGRVRPHPSRRAHALFDFAEPSEHARSSG